MGGTSTRIHIRLAAIVVGMFSCAQDGVAQGGNSGFVQVEGTHFVLNGRPFYFAGTNNYYQMIHRRAGKPGVDEVLDEMAERGMTVLRTWAFQDLAERNDCLQCAPARLLVDEAPTDFLDEATLVALDETLAEADARGIRLILALVNNWDDFGGMNRYTLWRLGSTDHDRFYVDPTIQGWFKQLITVLVNRVNTMNARVYRDDPTILAWQLGNEPRAASGAVSAGDFDAWVAEMSAFIKSLDPNHLVTTGVEGFYGPARAARNTNAWMAFQGTDFIDNHAHVTIDFATCHVWPQNWGWGPIGSTESAIAQAMQYFQQRLDDAENVLRKPLVLDEFGIPRDNFGRGAGSGTTTVRDGFYSAYYELCEASAAADGSCGGTANWIILDDESESYDDGNGVFLPSDASTDAIIAAHANFMLRLSDSANVPASSGGPLVALTALLLATGVIVIRRRLRSRRV